MRARRRNLHATPPRVECVMRPLDSGIFGHPSSVRARASIDRH
jgi:hypothetical protein